MKYLRVMGGAMKWTALAAWSWTACCGTLLAESPLPGGSKEPLDTASNYTLPYALIIMTIALGLLVVLHGSSRREREKPEEYQSKELLKGE